MRLFEFENSGLRITDWADDAGQTRIATYIENNCSDFLKVYRDQGLLLFSGMKFTKAPLYMGTSPTNRVPMNTSFDAHDKINVMLANEHFAARRDNSIFCTASLPIATNYGTAYAIFPLNGASFAWSSSIADLTESFFGADGEYEDPEFEADLTYMSSEAFVKKYNFINNTNLEGALLSHHEVMVTGKYVAVQPSVMEVFVKLKMGFLPWIKSAYQQNQNVA